MNKRAFKKLQEEWDRILKETGFQDIERTVNGQRVLAQFATNAYRQADMDSIQCKIEYFDKLCSNVLSFNFNNVVDRLVMEMYSQGVKIKNIVMTLQRKGHNIHRQTVRFIVRRHEHQWGIRAWTNKQMNLRPKK